jgi:hypothetical protein
MIRLGPLDNEDAAPTFPHTATMIQQYGLNADTFHLDT